LTATLRRPYSQRNDHGKLVSNRSISVLLADNQNLPHNLGYAPHNMWSFHFPQTQDTNAYVVGRIIYGVIIVRALLRMTFCLQCRRLRGGASARFEYENDNQTNYDEEQ